MVEKVHCSICGKTLSLRKEKRDDPQEGEVCSRCEAIICVDCVDWDYMAEHQTSEVYCRKCGGH